MAKQLELLTVEEVMERIRMKRTSARNIIKSFPHVKMPGKLLIESRYIDEWLRQHTVYPEAAVQEKPKRKPRPVEPLANGLIPYRHTGRKGA